MSKLEELRQKWQEKHSAAAALVDKESPTADESRQAGVLFDERDAFARQIEATEAELKAAAELRGRAEAGQKFLAEPVRTLPFNGAGGGDRPDLQGEKGGNWSRVDHVASPEEKRARTGGFKSLGHFAWCVYKAGRDGRGGEPSALKALGEWDALQSKMHAWEMEKKAPSGMFELSDPDGGLLVPPDFSQNDIYRRMIATNDLLRLVNPKPTNSNVVKRRALKEDSRVDGSRGGGILGYWENEADQYQKSKPQLRPVEYNIYKLTVLSYVTEEEMQDSDVAIDAFIGDLAAKEINYKVNDAIINGTGAGQPLGILASNSKITQAAITGQGANTIVFGNVTAMYSRVIAGQRGSLVWLYGQDAEPQLYGLFQPTGTAAGVLVFIPNQQGTGFNLYNRPALVIEQAKALGTAGDLIAFATDGYACSVRGGLQSAMSFHLRFDFDETAFKWRFRMGGRPWDDKPMTLANGSTTVSSIVILNSTRT